MEVSTYKAPTSWSDKGMNWDSPNPLGIDYAMALAYAIRERLHAASIDYSSIHFNTIQRIHIFPPPCQKLGTVNYDFALWVRRCIIALAPKFVDLESTKQGKVNKNHEIPIVYYSLSKLCSTEDTNVLILPGRGAPTTAFVDFFKRAKACLDKLTVVRASLSGNTLYADASIHDPPFSESISRALNKAKSDVKKGTFSGQQSSVWAWSGNTHYKTEPNGYCGYASFNNITIKRRTSPKKCKSNLIIGACAYMNETPISYSTVLQSYVFDNAGTGFMKDYAVFSAYGNFDSGEIVFGCKVNDIPRNSVVPRSTWSPKTIRRSTKRGFWANIYFFDDYNVAGGFQFRP